MPCASCGASTCRENPCLQCGASPLLDGRYRLDSILGQGQHGTTYAATRIADHEAVVAKELQFRGLDDWDRLERFRREAAVLRQLTHPDIPSLIEELETGAGKQKAVWLVQERVPGQSLEHELEDRRYDETEVLAVIRQMAKILSYLHNRRPPVVHRDIKPSNIIRRADDGLSLVDFGAVRDTLLDPTLGGATVSGTFGYMAPEQLRGDAQPASDVYALGATALRLLTREDPSQYVGFDGRLKVDRLHHLGPKLRHLIERMMTPDPSQRVADGTALTTAVDATVAAPAALTPASATNERAVVALGERELSEIPWVRNAARLMFSAGVAMIVGGFALGFGPKIGPLGIVLVIFSRTLVPHRRYRRPGRQRRNRRRLSDRAPTKR